MTPSARLGGFKVLKNAVRISPVFTKENAYYPAKLCQAFAKGKINLPYISCLSDGLSWGMNIMVDAADSIGAFQFVQKISANHFTYSSNSVVLSIFPHKKNPEITGTLFETFEREDIKPDALANSPSAISIILKEEYLNKASKALFKPFSFSSYSTPTDWKLAQEGKEELYKEVVASYQEQRPKVYGLEYCNMHEFIRIKMNNHNFGRFGGPFKEFSRLGLDLAFLVTGPCLEENNDLLAFCLPASEDHSCIGIINKVTSGLDMDRIFPVTVFSMNGPHFGDRYGIASELLTAFEKDNIDLLGLSCTIASIAGAVPSHQLEQAIQAIKKGFEVPSVTKKG